MATKLEKLNRNLEGTLFRVVRNGRKHEYTVYFDGLVNGLFKGVNALSQITDAFFVNPSILVCEINPQPTKVEESKKEDNTLITQYEIYKPVVVGGERTNMNITEIVFCSVTNKLFMCWFPGIHNFGKEFTFLTDEDNYIKSENDLISLLRFLIKDEYKVRKCSNLVYPEALEKAMKPEREEILQYNILKADPDSGEGWKTLAAQIFYSRETQCLNFKWLATNLNSKFFPVKTSDSTLCSWTKHHLINELSLLINEGYEIQEANHPLYPDALTKAISLSCRFTPQYNVMTNPKKQDVKEVFKAATIIYDNSSNAFKIIVEDRQEKIVNLINYGENFVIEPNNYKDLEYLLLNLLRRGFDIEYAGSPKYPNCFAYALEKYEQEQASNQLRDGIIKSSSNNQKNDLISEKAKEIIVNKIKLTIAKRDDKQSCFQLTDAESNYLRRKYNNKIDGMFEIAQALGIPDKDLNNLIK